MFRNTPRYPEINPNMTMEEISRRWSELVRALNQRDVSPINPTEVYGRGITVGGDETNTVFVTAGTSVSGAPSPAYWHIYEYQIPQDVGLINVSPVSVSSTANVQVKTHLPLAAAVPGRTITIAGYIPPGFTGAASFNLNPDVTPGSGDEIQSILLGSVNASLSIASASINVDTTVSSTFSGAAIVNNTTTSSFFSLNVNTTVSSSFSGGSVSNNTTANVSSTVSTTFQDNSGGPTTVNLPIAALISPSSVGNVGVFDASASTLTFVRNNFDNVVNTSVNVSVSSSFSGGTIVNNTTTSGGFTLSVESTVSSSIGAGAITNNTTTSASVSIASGTITGFSYPYLNFTFRALGNKWIQIA